MWLSQRWACWCSKLVPDSDNRAEPDARRSVTVTPSLCSAKDGFTRYNFYVFFFFFQLIKQPLFIGALKSGSCGLLEAPLDPLCSQAQHKASLRHVPAPVCPLISSKGTLMRRCRRRVACASVSRWSSSENAELDTKTKGISSHN